jgi:hypothetical protein
MYEAAEALQLQRHCSFRPGPETGLAPFGCLLVAIMFTELKWEPQMKRFVPGSPVLVLTLLAAVTGTGNHSDIGARFALHELFLRICVAVLGTTRR